MKMMLGFSAAAAEQLMSRKKARKWRMAAANDAMRCKLSSTYPRFRD
jgi:hypothetical protein